MAPLCAIILLESLGLLFGEILPFLGKDLISMDRMSDAEKMFGMCANGIEYMGFLKNLIEMKKMIRI